MKKFLFVLILSLMMPGLVMAKPERLLVKSEQKRNKEKNSKNVIKNIKVGNIEDPEARKAIKEILNYLELPYKK